MKQCYCHLPIYEQAVGGSLLVESLLKVWWVTGLNPPGGRMELFPVPFITCSINRRKEMFYLTKHSTHFIYGYMASGIW